MICEADAKSYGTIATTDEAIVYVRVLDMLITVQLCEKFTSCNHARKILRRPCFFKSGTKTITHILAEDRQISIGSRINRFVSFGILPNVSSVKLDPDVSSAQNAHFRTERLNEEQPKKNEKGWWQKCSCFCEKCTTVELCITGQCRQILQRFLGRAKVREKEGPSLGKWQVKIPHQRSPYAMKFEDGSQEKTARQELCARGDSWRLAKNIFQHQKEGKAAFHVPSEDWITPAASAISHEEREFVVDSRASMHMVSKKDLNKAELETVRISRNPTMVMTANGTVYVRELDIRDGNANWKYTGSSFTWKTLRRIWVQFSWNIESCTIRRTWFHPWVPLPHQLLPHLLRHGNSSYKRKWKGQRGLISMRKLVAWINRNRKSTPKKGWRGMTEWWVASCARLATGVEAWIGWWKCSRTSRCFHSLEPRANVVRSEHNICSQFPKNWNCDICLRTNITMACCRRRTGTVVPGAEILVIW